MPSRPSSQASLGSVLLCCVVHACGRRRHISTMLRLGDEGAYTADGTAGICGVMAVRISLFRYRKDTSRSGTAGRLQLRQLRPETPGDRSGPLADLRLGARVRHSGDSNDRQSPPRRFPVLGLCRPCACPGLAGAVDGDGNDGNQGTAPRHTSDTAYLGGQCGEQRCGLSYNYRASSPAPGSRAQRQAPRPEESEASVGERNLAIRGGPSRAARSPLDPVEPLSVGHVTFVSFDSALENSLDPRPERQLRQLRPGLRPTGHEALFSRVRRLGVRPARGSVQILVCATAVHAIRLPLPGGDPPACRLESVAAAPAPVLGIAEPFLLL